jgi:GTP cyclohydrolase I
MNRLQDAVTNEASDAEEADDEKFLKAGEMIIREIGVPISEAIEKTPLRFARSMQFLTRGYHTTVGELLNGAIFCDDHDEMITVKNIDFYSLCEHHLLPFFGKIHIAYIPDKKVIGLSKLPRLTELYTRRLQIQERLTREIAVCIEGALKPLGVAVVIKATY